MNPSSEKSARTTEMVLLALLAAAACVPALGVPFMWDDHLVIAPSGRHRGLRDVPAYFGGHYWKRAARVSDGPRPYRPIRETAFTIILSLGGGARAFHLVSMALHAANALLLFLLVKWMLGNRTIAFLSAALFAVHPVHTEALVWAKNLGELLAFFFMALSMLLFVAQDGPRAAGSKPAAPQIWLYVGSLTAFALALGTKESAVALPFLLVLWRCVRRADEPVAQPPSTGRAHSLGDCATLGPPAAFLLRLTPFLLLTAAYAACQLALIGPAAGNRAAAALSRPAVRLALAVETVWRYLRLLAIPVGLHGWREIALPRGLSCVHWIGLALLSAAALAALGAHRRGPAAAFGLLWTLLALGPVANLFAANAGRPVAEQRLYIPSAGWCVLLGALLAPLFAAHSEEAPNKRGSGMAAALLCMLAVLFACIGWVAAAPWRQDRHLFRHLVRWSPGVAAAQAMLGRAYDSSGRFALAFEQHRRACALNPHMAKLHNNLGAAYRRRGELDKAIEHFRCAISLQPHYAKPRLGLVGCLVDQGNRGRALAEIDKAILAIPSSARLHCMRGDLLVRQGDIGGALDSFRRALELDEGHVDAQCRLGNALRQLGQYEEARQEHLRATELAPEFAEAHARLGLDLTDLRRYAQAIESLERALNLDPSHFGARWTQARAYAIQKQFVQAANAFDLCLAAPEAATLQRKEKLKLHEQAADSFEKAGRRRDALTQWREIVKLRPGHAGAAAAFRRLGAGPSHGLAPQRGPRIKYTVPEIPIRQ